MRERCVVSRGCKTWPPSRRQLLIRCLPDPRVLGGLGFGLLNYVYSENRRGDPQCELAYVRS